MIDFITGELGAHKPSASNKSQMNQMETVLQNALNKLRCMLCIQKIAFVLIYLYAEPNKNFRAIKSRSYLGVIRVAGFEFKREREL